MNHVEEKTCNAVIEERSSSRRSALLMGGAALAGLVLSRTSFAQAAAVTDADILNFALNLEYLEAQFYTLATTGMTLDQAGIPTKGGDGTAGGAGRERASARLAVTTPLRQESAAEVANDEQTHVKFLQSHLAAAAVAQPP